MIWINLRAPAHTSTDPYFRLHFSSKILFSLNFLGMDIWKNNTWKPLFPHLIVRDPKSANRMLRLVPKNLRKSAGGPTSGDAFYPKPKINFVIDSFLFVPIDAYI